MELYSIHFHFTLVVDLNLSNSCLFAKKIFLKDRLIRSTVIYSPKIFQFLVGLCGIYTGLSPPKRFCLFLMVYFEI